MSWLVDNTNTICILLGLIAAALVVTWRFNQRVKFLGYAAGVLVLLALFWLVTRFIDTDGKHLEANVHAMAKAVMDGKVDDLFKYISNDFAYKEMTRGMLYEASRKSIEGHRVTDLRVTKFRVEQLSRETKFAKTSFLISGSAGDFNFLYRVETDFILEADVWKLKTMRFYNPVVNQDQEIRLPGFDFNSFRICFKTL